MQQIQTSTNEWENIKLEMKEYLGRVNVHNMRTVSRANPLTGCLTAYDCNSLNTEC